MFFLFLFLVWFSSKKIPFGLFFQSNSLNVVVGAFAKIRLHIHRILAGNRASQPLQSSLFKAKVAAKRLGVSSSSREIKGAFPENSVRTKMGIPIGRKLFHLIVNPGTADGCRVGNNWLQLVWSTRNENTKFRLERSNRENGPTYLDFPMGRTDDTFSIYCRIEISGNFENGKRRPKFFISLIYKCFKASAKNSTNRTIMIITTSSPSRFMSVRWIRLI